MKHFRGRELIGREYYRSLRHIKSLKDKQTRELSREFRVTGEVAILHKIVEGNLRLVITIARRIADNHPDFDDIVAEGNVGLMKAAEQYDPDMGVRFNSFATWWIRQAILSFLQNNEPRPVNKRIQGSAARQFKILTDKLHRQPTAEELAETLKCSTALAETLIASMGMQLVPLHQIPATENTHNIAYDPFGGPGISRDDIMKRLTDFEKIVVAARLRSIPEHDLVDVVDIKKGELNLAVAKTTRKAKGIYQQLLNVQV